MQLKNASQPKQDGRLMRTPHYVCFNLLRHCIRESHGPATEICFRIDKHQNANFAKPTLPGDTKYSLLIMSNRNIITLRR